MFGISDKLGCFLKKETFSSMLLHTVPTFNGKLDRFCNNIFFAITDVRLSLISLAVFLRKKHFPVCSFTLFQHLTVI